MIITIFKVKKSGMLRVKDGKFPLYADGSRYHSLCICDFEYLGSVTVYMFVCESKYVSVWVMAQG